MKHFRIKIKKWIYNVMGEDGVSYLIEKEERQKKKNGDM